ncbi:MAG: hypothetical protein MMC33_009686 [Icmadophila ericetorum]|nr:hypothetical protein [Icmadophila ericetorum]
MPNTSTHRFIPPAVEARQAFLRSTRAKNTAGTSGSNAGHGEPSLHFLVNHENTLVLSNDKRGTRPGVSQMSKTSGRPVNRANTHDSNSTNGFGHCGYGIDVLSHPPIKRTDSHREWDDFERSAIDSVDDFRGFDSINTKAPVTRRYKHTTSSNDCRHRNNNTHWNPQHHSKSNINNAHQRNTPILEGAGNTQPLNMYNFHITTTNFSNGDGQYGVNLNRKAENFHSWDNKHPQGYHTGNKRTCESPTLFSNMDLQTGKNTMMAISVEGVIQSSIYNNHDGPSANSNYLTSHSGKSTRPRTNHDNFNINYPYPVTAAEASANNSPDMKIPYYSTKRSDLEKNIAEVEAKMAQKKIDVENAEVRLEFTKRELGRKERKLSSSNQTQAVNSLGSVVQNFHIGANGGFPHHKIAAAAPRIPQIPTGPRFPLAYNHQQITNATNYLNDLSDHMEKLEKVFERLSLARQKRKERNERCRRERRVREKMERQERKMQGGDGGNGEGRMKEDVDEEKVDGRNEGYESGSSVDIIV